MGVTPWRKWPYGCHRKCLGLFAPDNLSIFHLTNVEKIFLATVLFRLVLKGPHYFILPAFWNSTCKVPVSRFKILNLEC